MDSRTNARDEQAMTATPSNETTQLLLPPDYYANLSKKNSSAGLLIFVAFIVQVPPGSIFGLNALTLKGLPSAFVGLIAFCTAVFNIDLMFFLALKGFDILTAAGYALEDILNQQFENRTITLSSVKDSLKTLVCRGDRPKYHALLDLSEDEVESGLSATTRGNTPEGKASGLLTLDDAKQAGKNLVSIDFTEWAIRRGSEAALTWWSLQNYAAFANSVGDTYPFLKPISWMLLPGFLQMNFPGVVGVTDMIMNYGGLLFLNINKLLPSDAVTNKIDRVNQQKNIAAELKKMATSLEAFMKTRAFPDDMPENHVRKIAFMSPKLDAAYQVIKELAEKETWQDTDKTNFIIAGISVTNYDPIWRQEAAEKSWAEFLTTPVIYGVVISTILIMFTILLTLLGEDPSFSVLEKVASTWVNIAVALIGALNFSDALIKKLFSDVFSVFTLQFDKNHASSNWATAAIMLGYALAACSSGSMIAVSIALFTLSELQKYALFAVLVISIATFNGSDVMNQILTVSKLLYGYLHGQPKNLSDAATEPLIEGDKLVALLKQEAMIPQLIRAIQLMPIADAIEALTSAINHKLVIDDQQQLTIIKRNKTVPYRLITNVHGKMVAQHSEVYDPVEEHMLVDKQMLPEVTRGQAATILPSAGTQLLASIIMLATFSNNMTYETLVYIPLALSLINTAAQFVGKNIFKTDTTSQKAIIADSLWAGIMTFATGVSSGLFIAFFNHFVATGLVPMPPANEYEGELTLAGCAAFSAVITMAAELEPTASTAPKVISDFFKPREGDQGQRQYSNILYSA